jgi:hypothetical protein
VRAARSQKVEKPQLGGTRIRQRKRNINVPLDAGSFADDIVAIFQDAAVEGADVETNLVRRGEGLSLSLGTSCRLRRRGRCWARARCARR